MNIFVGNLAFEAKDADVYKLFMGFGRVAFVSIVMDKKGTKSRGFAFLEMPDEQEAQAAIASLHGKEFMGRPLNVEPARPKPETGRDIRKREKMQSRLKIETQVAIEDKSENPIKPGFNPDFKRTGKYREGRRTFSFLRKRAQAGIKEPIAPQKKHKENPLRWRKKREQPKPWQKKPGESSPWQKKQEEAKPWQKRQGGSRPWEKSGIDESKPLSGVSGEFKQKSHGKPKPWQKSNNLKKKFQFKSRKKSGEHKR